MEQETRVLCSFTIVVGFTLLVCAQFFTNVVRSVPAAFKLRGNIARPKYCNHVFHALNKSKSVPVAKRPPWFDLMKEWNNTDNATDVQRRPVFYLTAGMDKGRLGNRMFAYAALFGVAWRNSKIPLWYNDELGLRTTFKQLRIDAEHKGPHRQDPFTTIQEPHWSLYNEATENLPPKNIHLRGYLLNQQYFAHVEDQLRYDFTFSPDVMRQAQRKLDAFNASSLRENGNVRVVIHVRRGDYSQRVDGFLQSQLGFFKRSMAYFTDCLPKVHFIVISDDVSWCRQNIFGHRVDFIEGERLPAVDLAIASLCDHAIVTHGTFGMWVAWFANGVTVRLSPD